VGESVSCVDEGVMVVRLGEPTGSGLVLSMRVGCPGVDEVDDRGGALDISCVGEMILLGPVCAKRNGGLPGSVIDRSCLETAAPVSAPNSAPKPSGHFEHPQDGLTDIAQCVIDTRKDITPLAQETLLGMVENLQRRTGENFAYLSSGDSEA
jgi:hypothetical protein